MITLLIQATSNATIRRDRDQNGHRLGPNLALNERAKGKTASRNWIQNGDPKDEARTTASKKYCGPNNGPGPRTSQGYRAQTSDMERLRAKAYEQDIDSLMMV